MWVGLLLSALSGLLQLLAYPPCHVWPIHLFSLVPLLCAVANAADLRRTLANGWIYGLVATAVTYAFILEFAKWGGVWAGLFWLLIVLYQSLFPLLFSFLFASVAGTISRQAALVWSPFLWTAVEYLATFGPLGINETLGHGQRDNFVLSPLAPLLGVNGISFFVVCVNVVAVLLLDRRSRVRPRTAAAFAVGLAILVASGLVIARQQKAQLLEGAGRPFSAALIAPRLDPQILNDAERGGEILELFARETKRLLETRPHPDVLLWPEMVFPYRFTKNGPTLREIESAVGDFQGEIIFGSAEWEDGRYYNSAFLASRDGLLSVYRKRKLFPFGEYTPWKPLLGSVRDYLPLKLRGEEYVEGDDVSPMRSVHARLGASICFESFLSDPIREQVLAGAEVLVNLTNDSWFDGTSLEERHFFVSGMRAMENGRPYIQSASWGVSGAVDAFGAILAQTNAKDGGSLTVAVTPFTELTLFTRLGPWRFLVLLVLNALLQTIAARSFKRQSFDALHSHLEKISNNATT